MRAKIIDCVVEAWPYFDEQLRLDNPNVSFPAVTADLDLSAFNAFEIHQDAAPVTNWGQRLVADEPEFINGEWSSVWSVVDLTASEIEAVQNSKWEQIRAERNAKLSASDWTQLPDAPVDAEAWAEYRQALRDITDAADPFAVVWPSAPQP